MRRVDAATEDTLEGGTVYSLEFQGRNNLLIYTIDVGFLEVVCFPRAQAGGVAVGADGRKTVFFGATDGVAG